MSDRKRLEEQFTDAVKEQKIPDGFINNLPVGINITGNCYDDQNVLNIAYALEGTMNYKDQIAKEVE